ncbi:serine/threonine-protein kinase [Novipirellula maiorica]|uniref:serine/threonine-protein kinase n=1 Tax=Novipirellula maiorica TaxID=1265734 RepID=UPI001360B08A|nr:serine/threonine-protein kinase [Rhodopirellula maiorica]
MSSAILSKLRTITQWSAGHRARRWMQIGILLLMMATAMVVLLNYQLRGTMQEMAGDSLRSILSAKLAVFDHWCDQHMARVSDAMQTDKRKTLAVRILTSHPSSHPVSPEQLRADPNLALFTQDVASTVVSGVSRDDVLGWALVDIDGRVLGSNVTSLFAEDLGIPSDSLEKMISRQVTLTRPFRSPKPLSRSGPLSQAEPAVIAVIAPVVQGARTLGGFLYLMDPAADFSELFSAAVAGSYATSYAIDRHGVMLTSAPCSHASPSSAAVHSDLSTSSILHQVVQIPGDQAGFKSTSSPSLSGPSLSGRSRPLTVLADQLTRGGRGENVVGYRDYRGDEVIGAWRWLPEYGIGVAVEMKVDDVYGPLHTFSRIHWALAMAMILGAVLLGGLHLFGPHLSRSLAQADSTRQLGQYKLGRLIGEGAMGSVYIGSHQLLKRQVAIKVLEKEELTSTAASRFAREVQLTAQLRHPNTIAIFDYGRTDDGTFYYVMEYVHGITLQALIDQYGRQPAGRVISLLIQMCGSLAEAHVRGIVHRDIKPANIILTEVSGVGDLIKVLDFGLVKEITRDTVELTQVDSITGTPMYMSPEAVRDASAANAQSDLYAVGAVGYALLAGVPLFEGGASVDICLKQLNEVPMRPAERIGVPLADDLQNVLMSCLQKDAHQRPMSMDELADTLRACEDYGAWTPVDSVHWWNHKFQGVDDAEASDVSVAFAPTATAEADGTSGGNGAAGTTVISGPTTTAPPRDFSG